MKPQLAFSLSGWALPLLAALLSGAGYALLHHGLIEVTADGWAYWEGAVSLLDGKGYHYFSGAELDDWPPFYSLYLSAWMWDFGPSGKSLVLANGTLAALQAAGWMVLGQKLAGTQTGPVSWRAAVALLYIAFFILLWEGPALAHNLLYTVLPFHVLATFAVVRAKGSGFAPLITVLLTSTILIITHNSGVVFVAASALAIFLLTERSLAARILLAEFVTVIPVGAWYGMRVLMHQEDSHPLGGGRYSAMEYIQQGISGAGNLVLPPPATYAGALGLAVMAAFTAYSMKDTTRMALVLPIMTAVPFLLLQVIFNITWISDPLSDARFSLFIPLMLVPGTLLLAKPRLAAVALAAFTLAALAIRLGNAAYFVKPPVFPNAVRANYALSWVLSPGQIVTSKDGGVLIGPPMFEWETQEAESVKAGEEKD
jgi:hypothetical protein